MEDIQTGEGPAATHGQLGLQLDEDDSNNEAGMRARNLIKQLFYSLLNLVCVVFLE